MKNETVPLKTLKFDFRDSVLAENDPDLQSPLDLSKEQVAQLLQRHSPHARFGAEVALDQHGKPQVVDGDVVIVGWSEKWHTTRRRPWAKRAERRAKNKRSRLARRKNRNG